MVLDPSQSESMPGIEGTFPSRTRYLDDDMMPSARRQVKNTLTIIYEKGMTTTSGGNVSCLDEGHYFVTPTGRDKGELDEAAIVEVDASGKVIGEGKPSIEFPVHKKIYDVRPDIRAVIHLHADSIVSLCIGHDVPDTGIIRQAGSICGNIASSPYATPGTMELADGVAAQFAAGADCVHMENHGVIVGGRNMMEAHMRVETLEFCALTQLKAERLAKGTAEPRSLYRLSRAELEEYERQASSLMPEMAEVEYPSSERELRAEICAKVKRACEHGLMISSYGTVSARWRGNDFLITPRNISRWDLKPRDIVQIRDGMREPGKLPSRSTEIHAAIYRAHPEINSIFITQSPNAMAFAVTHMDIPSNTIPESWLLLQKVSRVPFSAHFGEVGLFAELVTPSNSVLMIENDAIIVAGTTVLNAYDRLEVVEATASNALNAISRGKLIPIPEEGIEALKLKFMS